MLTLIEEGESSSSSKSTDSRKIS